MQNRCGAAMSTLGGRKEVAALVSCAAPRLL
jgi:hypothetical protein